MVYLDVAEKAHHELLNEVLRGNLSEIVKLNIPKSKVGLLVSSTFTDTHLERNILLEEILPKLQVHGRDNEIVVTFVDMRYGMKDANALDQKTWIYCAREVRRCFEESAGIFFLSLQSEKYGYMPIPKYVDKSLFDKRKKQWNDETKEQANIWYHLDNNAIPAHYTLKNLRSLRDHDYWNVALPKLREGLKDIPFDESSGPDIKVHRSVTEWEVTLALRLDPSGSRISWLHRVFEGGVSREEDDKERFCDTHQDFVKKNFNDLIDFMNAHIQPANIFNFSLPFQSYENKDEQFQKYIEDWKTQTEGKLTAELENVIRKREDWARDGCGYGLTGQELDEMVHHAQLAHLKCEGFHGREELLAAAMEALAMPNRTVAEATSLAVVVSPGSERTVMDEFPGHDDRDADDLSDTRTERDASSGEDALLAESAPLARPLGHPRKSADLQLEEHLKGFSQQPSHSQGVAEADLVEGDGEGDVDAEGEEDEGDEEEEEGEEDDGEEGEEEGSGSEEEEDEEGDEEDSAGTDDEADDLPHSAPAMTTFIYSHQEPKKIKALDGISLCLIGASGSGKTALVAMLAKGLASKNPTIPVIVRFCGTSEGSADGLVLVRSICLQIQRIYREEAKVTIPVKYEEAVEYFQSLLQKYPVVLFIDSLDQLTDAFLARSQISFLAGVKPHPDTRIIVSALPDERDPVTGDWIYCYQCDTRLKDGHVPRVNVPRFEGDDIDKAKDIMEQLLRQKKRKLTSAQMSYVMDCVRVEPTALYLNLAVQLVSEWTSTDVEMRLAPSVQGLIHQIFDFMERDYGSKFTHFAIGFITFSVNGVSDLEMQDLLSLSDEVLDECFQYSKPDGVYRLPFHMWIRWKAAMEGLVVEREGHCLHWFHRQLRETAVKRFDEATKLKLHKIMGQYFGDIVDEDIVAKRMVTRQPLIMNDLPIWFGNSKFNKRRCEESSFHLVTAGLCVEAAEEICSFDIICGASMLGLGFRLVNSMVDLQAQFAVLAEKRREEKASGVEKAATEDEDKEADDEEFETAKSITEHYLRWIRQDMTYIAKNPRLNLVSSASAQPTVSIVQNDVIRLVSMFRSRKKFVDYNENDWLRQQTMAKASAFGPLIATLQGHMSRITSVFISASGKRIVSCSWDFTIKIWDVITGNCLSTLEGHTSWVKSVCMSANEKVVLSGSLDKTLRVWDVTTGSSMLTMEGHLEGVTSVALSGDGKTAVSGSYDNTVKVWDVSTGECKMTLEGHTCNVEAVCMSPDIRLIVSCSFDKTIKIWEGASGNLVHSLEGHSDGVSAISLSADGKVLASGSFDKTIKIWDTGTAACISTITCSEMVSSVSLSADGKTLASGTRDLPVKVWDVATSQNTATLRGHSSSVETVCMSADGKVIVSGAYDNTVRVWDVAAGASTAATGGVRQTKDSIDTICLSSSGKVVISGSEDKTIKMWDVATGVCVSSLKGHTDRVRSVYLSITGKMIVSGSNDKTVRIWDVYSGKNIISLREHTDKVNSVWLSTNCKTAISGSDDCTIRVWDIVSGTCTAVLKGHTGGVTSVCMSIDGGFVISGSEDSTIKVWVVQTGRCIITMREHAGGVTGVVLSADEKYIVSGSKDGTVRLWDVATGSCAMSIQMPTPGTIVTSACISADGKVIVTGCSDSCLYVWNVATRVCISVLRGHVESVSSVTLSGDGKLIVSGSLDGRVKVWDVVASEVAVATTGTLDQRILGDYKGIPVFRSVGKINSKVFGAPQAKETKDGGVGDGASATDDDGPPSNGPIKIKKSTSASGFALTTPVSVSSTLLAPTAASLGVSGRPVSSKKTIRQHSSSRFDETATPSSISSSDSGLENSLPKISRNTMSTSDLTKPLGLTKSIASPRVQSLSSPRQSSIPSPRNSSTSKSSPLPAPHTKKVSEALSAEFGSADPTNPQVARPSPFVIARSSSTSVVEPTKKLAQSRKSNDNFHEGLVKVEEEPETKREKSLVAPNTTTAVPTKSPGGSNSATTTIPKKKLVKTKPVDTGRLAALAAPRAEAAATVTAVEDDDVEKKKKTLKVDSARLAALAAPQARPALIVGTEDSPEDDKNVSPKASKKKAGIDVKSAASTSSDLSKKKTPVNTLPINAVFWSADGLVDGDDFDDKSVTSLGSSNYSGINTSFRGANFRRPMPVPKPKKKKKSKRHPERLAALAAPLPRSSVVLNVDMKKIIESLTDDKPVATAGAESSAPGDNSHQALPTHTSGRSSLELLAALVNPLFHSNAQGAQPDALKSSADLKGAAPPSSGSSAFASLVSHAEESPTAPKPKAKKKAAHKVDHARLDALAVPQQPRASLGPHNAIDLKKSMDAAAAVDHSGTQASTENHGTKKVVAKKINSSNRAFTAERAKRDAGNMPRTGTQMNVLLPTSEQPTKAAAGTSSTPAATAPAVETKSNLGATLSFLNVRQATTTANDTRLGKSASGSSIVPVSVNTAGQEVSNQQKGSGFSLLSMFGFKPKVQPLP